MSLSLARAITVAATPAELRSIPGPELPRYVWVLSLAAVFRWVAGSNATDDGFTVLVPNTGGFLGAWLRCRPSPTPSGTTVALTDGNQHVNVGQGLWFTASAFTGDHTVTIDTTNAAQGDEVEFLNPSAHVLTLANGGAGAGTIKALPAGSFCVAYFDGTNWIHRRSALTL